MAMEMLQDQPEPHGHEDDIDEKYRHITRQLGIIHPDLLTTPITVFGVGAIGSFLTLGLAKCGFTDLTVLDDDDVSMENMSCSLYRRGDVGKKKVEALQELIREFTKTEIKAEARRFADVDDDDRPIRYEVPPDGFSVVCVDSMAVRARIWDVFKERQKRPHAWFIDSRMSAEEGQIYTLRPALKEDREMYEVTLYSDDQAVQEPCTERSTTYTAFLLPGQIINTIKSVLTKQPEEHARITQWSIKHSDMLAHKMLTESKSA